MSAPESFRSIPLHFRDLHGKPQRQQVRKQELTRARDGSESWRNSCLECSPDWRRCDYTESRNEIHGTHRGARELRNYKMILLLAIAIPVATCKVCARAPPTKRQMPYPVTDAAR